MEGGRERERGKREGEKGGRMGVSREKREE